jgi:hypothetical protein
MNNSENIEFITTENVEMLWEVCTEEAKQNNKPSRQQFILQVRDFFEKEPNKKPLIDLNKGFVMQFMSQTSITKEDIQSKRLSEFDQSLSQAKADFQQAITVTAPEVPTFGDSMKDEPIGASMSELIARTIAQRNLELETIQSQNNKVEASAWLTPAETSVKIEKIQENENIKLTIQQKQIQYQYANSAPAMTPTFIKIGEEVDDPLAMKKQLTWGENKEYDAPNESIFSKLKPMKQETIDGETSNLIKTMYNKVNDLEEKMNQILQFIAKQEKEQEEKK